MSFNPDSISPGQPERERIPKFEILESGKLRTELRDRTVKLVHTAAESGVDTLVFLDKSSRPIYWLFKDLWEREMPNREMPDIKFLNIGSGHRENTEKSTDDAANIDDRVEKLKEIFGEELSNKSILVVDDVRHSGRSLNMAQEIINRAYPGSSVKKTAIFNSTETDILPWVGDNIFGKSGFLPWMKIPGAAGVIEHDQELLAHSITEDNLHNKLRELDEKLKKEVNLGGMDNFQQLRLEWGVARVKDKRYIKTVKKYLERNPVIKFYLLEGQEDMLEPLGLIDTQIPAVDNFEGQSNFIINMWDVKEALAKIEKRAEALKRKIFDSDEDDKLGEKELGVLTKISLVAYSAEYLLSDNLKGLSPELLSEISLHRNALRLKKAGKQLRQEMRAIAEAV